MGIVRAKPRRWERASSIVWFARFCSFLVSSRVTTSGTIESIVSSTMARMFALNALSCSASLGLDGLGLGLGGGVLQLVVEVLAGDVVLGVRALDLVLHGLLGALLVALDLRGA